MKRDDFIGNKFDGAIDKLIECIAEMEELGQMTGDLNFDLFATLLKSVFIAAGNKDMQEMFMVLQPFLLKKAMEEEAREQAEADLPADLPQEIKDLLKGLNGPDKLN